MESVCYEILREITRVNRAYDSDKFVVYASVAVADALEGEESHALAELELLLVNKLKFKLNLFISKSSLTSL